jgi:cytochrome c oxidase assembly protein subunit 15
MTLDEFKGIFFWEYWHRVLGRLIGVVFLLPFLYFWLRGKLEPALVPKLLGIFVLGGLQGAMGWYMVKSGLVDDPRVSHYRLTAHLSLAFLIFIAMFWVALGLLSRARPGTPRCGAEKPAAHWLLADDPGRLHGRQRRLSSPAFAPARPTTASR